MTDVLLATATTIGRLTGTTPREAQLVFEAMRTPSAVKPGRAMYRGRKTDDRVDVVDALVLLGNHGIATALTTFGQDDGAAALAELSAAVADPGKAVLVALRSAAPDDRHVVVTGLDVAAGTVWLDDSTWTDADAESGRPRPAALAAPVAEFLRDWRAAGFVAIVAELTGAPAPPPVPWSRVRPRRESADARRRDRRR